MRHYGKRYKKENAKKVSARCRNHRIANHDLYVARDRANKTLNPEGRRNTLLKWQKKNPLKVRAHRKNYKARKRGAIGSHTAEEVLILFEKQKRCCAICKLALTEYDQDHIYPLSVGGSNWIGNIQLLCRACNQKKHAKDPIQFMQSIGFLI